MLFNPVIQIIMVREKTNKILNQKNRGEYQITEFKYDNRIGIEYYILIEKDGQVIGRIFFENNKRTPSLQISNQEGLVAAEKLCGELNTKKNANKTNEISSILN